MKFHLVTNKSTGKGILFANIMDHKALVDYYRVRNAYTVQEFELYKSPYIFEGTNLKEVFGETQDILTIEEFADEVDQGTITDYDGHGEWAIGDKPIGEKVWPGTFDSQNIPGGATHVIWYNK